MTREEAIHKLNTECEPNADTEQEHMRADEILCELLTSLGYADVVEAWEKVYKWYA